MFSGQGNKSRWIEGKNKFIRRGKIPPLLSCVSLAGNMNRMAGFVFWGDGMIKTFIYCEATEGGMDSYIVYSSDDLKSLYGWMSRDCRKEDEFLVAWMETAAVGEHLDHRLGVIVRLKDEGEQ